MLRWDSLVSVCLSVRRGRSLRWPNPLPSSRFVDATWFPHARSSPLTDLTRYSIHNSHPLRDKRMVRSAHIVGFSKTHPCFSSPHLQGITGCRIPWSAVPGRYRRSTCPVSQVEGGDPITDSLGPSTSHKPWPLCFSRHPPVSCGICALGIYSQSQAEGRRSLLPACSLGASHIALEFERLSTPIYSLDVMMPSSGDMLPERVPERSML